MNTFVDWITPNWPAPDNVHALTTCRGAESEIDTIGLETDYGHFNLALHVDDDPEMVLANRKTLKKIAKLPNEPLWLNQVHGSNVIDAADTIVYTNTNTNIFQSQPPTADGSFSLLANRVCTVLSADCLPIVLCDKKGSRVSAIHAGWKSMAAGIIEVAMGKLQCPPQELLIWLGPAIGPSIYEVKEDFLLAFNASKDNYNTDIFKPLYKVANNSGNNFDNVPTHWLANLYALARLRLEQLGVQSSDIYGGNYCTYSDSKRFYSARRSKRTGRMATLIWFT